MALTPVEEAGEFVGTVRSRRRTTIQPQAEGFLTRILVTSGQRVAPGDPLFEIDATTLRAAVAALESVRAAREADAAFARQQAERARTLVDVGAISRQEYEQATTLQKTAEAQLKAAEEQIRQQQSDLAYYRVAATTPGVIGDVPVRVGDRVTRATALTTIEDNSGLELYINVPVQQAPMLKVGLPVRILDEAGDVVATERINFIASSVDDSTQTVLAKAPVGASRGGFRSEQFVRVAVVFSTAQTLTVPLVSTLRINGRYFVFVAEAGPAGIVARQRAVELGRVAGNSYVVVSGVAAGDRLIVSGIQKIGDGAPVAPAASATSGGQ